MSLNNKLRQEAKVDSRRFAKSITCRIVHGQLLVFCIENSIVPKGLIPSVELGLDTINSKLLGIPVNQYKMITDLFSEYSGNTKGQKIDTEYIQARISKKEYLVQTIKQALVLINMSSIKPEGKSAGLLPSLWDVQIDSIDINQSIEGTYVPRARIGIKRERGLSDK
jgi:hypothetical protein